jgi:hypothetical protein
MRLSDYCPGAKFGPCMIVLNFCSAGDRDAGDFEKNNVLQGFTKEPFKYILDSEFITA